MEKPEKLPFFFCLRLRITNVKWNPLPLRAFIAFQKSGSDGGFVLVRTAELPRSVPVPFRSPLRSGLNPAVDPNSSHYTFKSYVEEEA